VTPRWRTALFLVAAAVAGVVLVVGYTGLPDFGAYHGVYGRALQLIAVPQRHATDVVTAVNFDYRAFDTLGEEFILLASVTGLAILLRQHRGERERAPDEADEPGFKDTSDALAALSLLLVGPTLVLGAYIVTHGTLTPGGGFQGGVNLAAALLLVYAAGQLLALERVRPVDLVELAEAVGAAAYVLVAIGGLVFGVAAMANFLPLGTSGSLLSGGTIPVLNVAVGIEVAGAITIILTEFLDQALLQGGGDQ
jgi:multicomponent Na+:H+ antiporter subunit B